MDMKKCDMCHEFQPLELFSRNKSRKDGFHSTCKPCKKCLDVKYQKNHKDIIKVRRHEYYVGNKEEITKKTTAYIAANPKRHNAYGVKAKRKLKKKVCSQYCSGEVKCKYCSVDDMRLLTIDHIAGGGNKHRQAIGVKTAGDAFYRWLKRNGFPKGYQVLCWNCQYRKRQKEMRSPNPSKRQQQLAANAEKTKQQCFEKYGAVCPCGEKDLVVLTLDHVNNDGAQHRAAINKKGTGFYLYLRRNGFPNEPPLQVLCLNCQYRKNQ
jgi:hypothetical protein